MAGLIKICAFLLATIVPKTKGDIIVYSDPQDRILLVLNEEEARFGIYITEPWFNSGTLNFPLAFGFYDISNSTLLLISKKNDFVLEFNYSDSLLSPKTAFPFLQTQFKKSPLYSFDTQEELHRAFQFFDTTLIYNCNNQVKSDTGEIDTSTVRGLYFFVPRFPMKHSNQLDKKADPWIEFTGENYSCHAQVCDTLPGLDNVDGTQDIVLSNGKWYLFNDTLILRDSIVKSNFVFKKYRDKLYPVSFFNTSCIYTNKDW